MKMLEWTMEVKRVAKVLGLNVDQTQELIKWTISLAYDKLGKAQQYFKVEA